MPTPTEPYKELQNVRDQLNAFFRYADQLKKDRPHSGDLDDLTKSDEYIWLKKQADHLNTINLD